MTNLHLHQEDRTITTLLGRIKGEPVKPRTNQADAMYEQLIPEPNRSKLLGFYRSLITQELSLGRVAVLLGNMYRISIWLDNRPFEQLSREDLIDLVGKIRNIKLKKRAKATVTEGYAEQTVESYKMTIKKFWRWLKNPGSMPEELAEMEYPAEVSWIKRRKSKNGLLPKDIWTPEEVNILARITNNTRDRAFVLGLWGSGCRIGEFLTLRREDVMFDRYSCQILVDGKTGSRRVRLTPAASLAMAAWLDIHPNKDRNAPVWVNIQLRSEIPSRNLTYTWAYKMLRDLAKKAKIEKSIRPHLLRHSLATYYAPKLTESVMNEHFGWRQGGRTASIYTHLSGKQVDEQILSVFGKKQIDVKSNQAVDIVLCPRCGLKSTHASIQCSKCGFPLTDKAAKELYERREKADKLMNRLVENPKFLSALEQALNNVSIAPEIGTDEGAGEYDD